MCFLVAVRPYNIVLLYIFLFTDIVNIIFFEQKFLSFSAEGGSITEANPICSAEKDTSGKSEAHSLEDENIEPVKKAKLEVDCAEELPFAYFEKQPTSASLLSRNEECETSISAGNI